MEVEGNTLLELFEASIREDERIDRAIDYIEREAPSFWDRWAYDESNNRLVFYSMKVKLDEAHNPPPKVVDVLRKMDGESEIDILKKKGDNEDEK